MKRNRRVSLTPLLDLLPNFKDEWTKRALREGWLVSADCHIERDDDNPRFKDDDEAFKFVAMSARAGSRMHLVALVNHLSTFHPEAQE